MLSSQSPFRCSARVSHRGKTGMSIRRWSQDVILVDLPRGPEKQRELQTVREMVRDRSDCDVVIDFSQVDVVGGACLAWLLDIRRLLHACGRRLTLCHVAPATRGVFTIAALDGLFEFAEDRSAALASLRLIGRPRSLWMI
jgi:anti-anti-sigma regulatory factor